MKLTITMKEVDGGPGGNNLIDKFTVMLSLSGGNNVTYLIGDEEIATIKLMYLIYVSCANLENCSTHQSTPEC